MPVFVSAFVGLAGTSRYMKTNMLDILHKNVDTAKKIIKLAISRIPEKRNCGCANALEMAIVTAPDMIPAEQKKKLDLLMGKYLTREDN